MAHKYALHIVARGRRHVAAYRTGLTLCPEVPARDEEYVLVWGCFGRNAGATLTEILIDSNESEESQVAKASSADLANYRGGD